MTLIEWFLAIFLVAAVVLLSLIWMTLRDGLHTLILQGSQRRQWKERDEQRA